MITSACWVASAPRKSKSYGVEVSLRSHSCPTHSVHAKNPNALSTNKCDIIILLKLWRSGKRESLSLGHGSKMRTKPQCTSISREYLIGISTTSSVYDFRVAFRRFNNHSGQTMLMGKRRFGKN